MTWGDGTRCQYGVNGGARFERVLVLCRCSHLTAKDETRSEGARVGVWESLHSSVVNGRRWMRGRGEEGGRKWGASAVFHTIRRVCSRLAPVPPVPLPSMGGCSPSAQKSKDRLRRLFYKIDTFAWLLQSSMQAVAIIVVPFLHPGRFASLRSEGMLTSHPFDLTHENDQMYVCTYLSVGTLLISNQYCLEPSRAIRCKEKLTLYAFVINFAHGGIRYLRIINFDRKSSDMASVPVSLS